MKKQFILIMLLSIISLVANPAFAKNKMPQTPQKTIDLGGFQSADNAITTHYKGDMVDVYFASKSLLMAADAGFDIKTPAHKWIAWAINMQSDDGLFSRYEYNKDAGEWYYADDADADDAVLALWIELLYRTSATSKMPAKWQKSIKLASKQLEELFDQKQGIYHVSKNLPVGLLMDNVEIYAAFKAISVNARKKGLTDLGIIYANKASQLALNIQKIFMEDNGIYRISTQLRDSDSFYPDKVAQLYPIFYGLPNPAANQTTKSATNSTSQQYKDWIVNNGEEWLNNKKDYPWGLIAVLAIAVKNPETASCWQNRAEPFRYSPQWNVLEETALQIVKYNVLEEQKTHIPCVGNLEAKGA